MSGGALSTAPSDDRGGRTFGFGRRRAFAAAAALALVVVAVVVLALKPGGAGGTIDVHGRNLPLTEKFGHPAKWLKIPTAPAVTIATATPRNPQLHAMQGYPVLAKLPQGSVQISVQGPVVPSWVSQEAGAGKWPGGAAVPSTFDVTFKAAKAAIPLSTSDFDVVTYNGELLHPKITTAAGGSIPAAIPSGKAVTLKLATSLPQGDGEVRWAPGGKRILVAYFWTLELD
jgi:hypothetical protein